MLSAQGLMDSGPHGRRQEPSVGARTFRAWGREQRGLSPKTAAKEALRPSGAPPLQPHLFSSTELIPLRAFARASPGFPFSRSPCS